MVLDAVKLEKFPGCLKSAGRTFPHNDGRTCWREHPCSRFSRMHYATAQGENQCYRTGDSLSWRAELEGVKTRGQGDLEAGRMRYWSRSRRDEGRTQMSCPTSAWSFSRGGPRWEFRKC